MTEYMLKVVSETRLEELLGEIFPGVPYLTRCANYHHGPDVLCGIERDQLLDAVPIVDHHRIQAFDDDEAQRLATCLVGAEYSEQAIARLFDPDGIRLADLDGTRVVHPVY